MLDQYRLFAKNYLALPVVCGVKTPSERFPGANETYCIEAMMQDMKGLQAGTSHDLGQNFAKAFDIQFADEDGALKHVHMTSWGVATRLIGALIMAHSDDDGLRLPPMVAPKHVVIIPFITNPEQESEIMEYANKLAEDIKKQNYADSPIEVIVDTRDMRGGEKNWHWVKKGIPVRIEVGARDIESGTVCVARRDRGPKDKEQLPFDETAEKIPSILSEMQNNYYKQAAKFLKENTVTNISTFEDLQKFFTPKNAKKPEIHGGFVHAKWCGDDECEDKLSAFKVSIRCLPLEQSGTSGKCIVCGREATKDAIYAKAY